MIPGCIWWTIWRERNLRCFAGKRDSIQKIKLNCIVLFNFWCKQTYIGDTEALMQVLEPLQCNIIFAQLTVSSHSVIMASQSLLILIQVVAISRKKHQKGDDTLTDLLLTNRFTSTRLVDEFSAYKFSSQGAKSLISAYLKQNFLSSFSFLPGGLGDNGASLRGVVPVLA